MKIVINETLERKVLTPLLIGSTIACGVAAFNSGFDYLSLHQQASMAIDPEQAAEIGGQANSALYTALKLQGLSLASGVMTLVEGWPMFRRGLYETGMK